MGNGESVIIGCMAVAVANTTIVTIKRSGSATPGVRVVVGGVLVTTILLAVSDSNANIAKSFAILIMLATLFGPNGNELISLLSRLVG